MQLILLSEGSFTVFKSGKKKKSVPKTEGKSVLFYIDNEFPNIISVTSEAGFPDKTFQLLNPYPDFWWFFSHNTIV